MKKYNSEMDYTRIKELRLNNNLTQKQMADILDIQKATYTQFEIMKREIFPITKFNDIANYFNVSMNYLLKLDDNPSIKIKNKELNTKEIGKRIKDFRKENRLYQDTLAKEIGTSSALISQYESGKRLLSLTYGYAICKKYNISIDYLYGKIDNPKYLK